MSSSAKYFVRLDTGNQITYGNDPPVYYELTSERASRNIVSSFEYCHNQSSESESFAMQNDVAVGGIIKAFSISAKHAHQFATASSKSRQDGKEISTYQNDYARDVESQKFHVGKGQVSRNDFWG